MIRKLLAAAVVTLALSVADAASDWSKPADTLVYYGWVSSFNYPTNQWSNEAVAQDMSRYDIIVLGNGVADPQHGDYSNAMWIIARIKQLNASALIFGYATVDQALNDFRFDVDDWDDAGVHGIFGDEAGYDFGRTRDEFNDRVDDAHGHGLLFMANAWYPQHVLGTADGIGGYYNSTYNSDLDASSLGSSDFLYLESLAVNTVAYTATGGYEARSQWAARKSAIETLRGSFTINFVGGCVIANGDSNAQKLFDFAWASAIMLQLEAIGSSDSSYGASSAQVTFWTRPSWPD